MPFQFTFTRLRFFFLILAMLVAAILLFAVGRVTGRGSSAAAASPDASAAGGSPSGAPGMSLNDKMAARNAQYQKVGQVQGLLGIAPLPGQALVGRGMTSATGLAAMTPNAGTAATATGGGAPAAGAPSAIPPAAAGAPAGSVPNAMSSVASSPPAAAPGTPAAAPNGTALDTPNAAASGTAPAVGPAELTPARLAYATAADPASEPFVLQFGAFRQQKEAKDLQARLLQKGIAAQIVTKVSSEDNLIWQTVRFGGYKDVPTALKAASEYEKQGFLAFVRPADSI